jgi:HTH-type transcriptional regulator / antitoxin HigA
MVTSIKPVRTAADYEAAMKEVERLWGAKLGTPKGDRLDVLATLIDAYEEKYFPIDKPTPVEAIKFRMEQHGLTRKDLEPMIGGRGRVSEVLEQKRALSIEMIRSIHAQLDIPAEVLIQPAGPKKNWAAAKEKRGKRKVVRRATTARSSKGKSGTSASR